MISDLISLILKVSLSQHSLNLIVLYAYYTYLGCGCLILIVVQLHVAVCCAILILVGRGGGGDASALPLRIVICAILTLHRFLRIFVVALYSGQSLGALLGLVLALALFCRLNFSLLLLSDVALVRLINLIFLLRAQKFWCVRRIIVHLI